MSTLDGKVALVTGSSHPAGIGLAIARRLASEGCSLYLVAEGTAEQLEAACAECRSTGAPRAEFGVFDLAASGAAEQMVADALARLGHIDVLINNAAARSPYDFGDYTREEFERVVGVNLASAFFASQAVLPDMRARGGGRIIHIASQLGEVAHTKSCLYGLTKAALIHLTKSMALELGRDGIVVNAISPGPVMTQHNLARTSADPGYAASRLVQVPLGRFGMPEEIADVAHYLATTSTTFLQGENIIVDGGYVIH